MIEILTPDFEFGDDRGFLCQLVHGGYKQVNVVYSNKGVYRGGHYHKINTEAFYVVSGAFEVTVTDGEKKQIYTFKKGDMFSIKPGVWHDFNYVEDTVLVGLYDVGVELDDGTKDICTE